MPERQGHYTRRNAALQQVLSGVALAGALQHAAGEGGEIVDAVIGDVEVGAHRLQDGVGA